MCISLEATQKGYTFMVYTLIQDINPEDPDEMLDVDDKIPKVLCISYIDVHYAFLLKDKVNHSVEIVEQSGGFGYSKKYLIESYLRYVRNLLVILKWAKKCKERSNPGTIL